jgi:hypothetical protein
MSRIDSIKHNPTLRSFTSYLPYSRPLNLLALFSLNYQTYFNYLQHCLSRQSVFHTTVITSPTTVMSSSTGILLAGGCMCGNVTYISTALPLDMTNCHCQTCRRLSGAPFTTFAGFPTTAITWIGEDRIKKAKYSEIAERGHCSECGSPLYMQYQCSKETISITAGSIDEKSVKGKLPKPDHHIFVEDGEKAGWYDIEDKLPKSFKFST